MFKVNHKDTRTTPGVVQVSLLLILNYFTPCSSVSIANFVHVIAMKYFEHEISNIIFLGET